MSDQAFYATLQDGRLLPEEPLKGVPEGVRLKLVLLDQEEDDEMSDEERERLHAAIDQSRAEYAAGQFVTPEELFREAKERYK